MSAHASWLAQVGRGVLIGQNARRLFTKEGESIDRPRVRSNRQLAFSCLIVIKTWINAKLYKPFPKANMKGNRCKLALISHLQNGSMSDFAQKSRLLNSVQLRV